MTKQAASGKTKVNAFIREFHNEFISTPTDELFCKLCEKVVKHDKRFHVDQHRNGSVHQAKLKIQLPAGNRLYRPQTIQILTKRLLKRFWAPIFLSKKLRHPAIRRLFIDMGHPLPSDLPVEELLKILQRKKRIKWYITSRIKISLLWLTKQKLMQKSTWTYWEDMLRIRRIQWPWSQLFYKVPQIKQQLFSILTIYQKITNWKEEFWAATFRFCIIYDSRWKGIKVTLQQFISRYLCLTSPSQLRRKNQKQV